MNHSLANLEVKELEKMYLRETHVLKCKLLSGVFGKNILRQKNKVVELALAIHAKQYEERVASNHFCMEQV